MVVARMGDRIDQTYRMSPRHAIELVGSWAEECLKEATRDRAAFGPNDPSAEINIREAERHLNWLSHRTR